MKIGGLFLCLIFAAILFWFGLTIFNWRQSTSSSPTNSPTPNSTSPTQRSVYGFSEGSIEYNAITLVGFDNGNKLPESDDIRIKRTTYLLTLVVNETKENPTEIATGVDSVSRTIENQFGKRVTRQQLLEDSVTMFRTADKKNTQNQKFKNLIALWALLKYGK